MIRGLEVSSLAAVTKSSSGVGYRSHWLDLVDETRAAVSVGDPARTLKEAHLGGAQEFLEGSICQKSPLASQHYAKTFYAHPVFSLLKYQPVVCFTEAVGPGSASRGI